MVLPRENMSELDTAVGAGIGALLIAEEALGRSERQALLDVHGAQPEWSDLPTVLLLSAGELTVGLSPSVRGIVQRGNVTVLARPVRVATLTAAPEPECQRKADRLESRMTFNLIRVALHGSHAILVGQPARLRGLMS